MEFSGLALWADNESGRPSWVRGTWRVDGGVIRRVSEAKNVPSEGSVVSGMMDTYCYVGCSEFGSMSEAEMVEQVRATLTSGVTAARDCGVPVDNSPVARTTGLHLIRCGRHVAHPKRYMCDLPLDADNQSMLLAVLTSMAHPSDGWVKIAGDRTDRSVGADSGLTLLRGPVVLTDVVAAVYEAGAGIAVYAFSHRVIDLLTEAGVDDIEHGSGIDADQVNEITARGIAVMSTPCQVELFKDFAAQVGAKYPVYAATVRVMYDERCSHPEMLVDSDVLLLIGIDSNGYQSHGTVVGELDPWLRWGVPAEFAIDATTWVSQRYLGYPGPVEGGPADFLTLDEDPRASPTIFANLVRTTVGGTPIWECLSS